MPFQILQSEARSILSPVSGFLAEAGFTHSLTPARNCTFGCSYCYVPTMRVQAGLRADDWNHWGSADYVQEQYSGTGAARASPSSSDLLFTSDGPIPARRIGRMPDAGPA